jgi:phosphate transport system protein
MCGEESDKPPPGGLGGGAGGLLVTYARAVPREEFQHELDEIEALLQDSGRLCGRSLEVVLGSLEAADAARAQQVIADDDEIDSIYLRIESSIESLLARQAPVAVDLRLVLSMIHINLHLERIGDQCVNVAKLALLIPPDPPLPDELLGDFSTMGRQAQAMIAEALRSFGARDLAGAESLLAMDQVINRTNQGLSRRILALSGDAPSHEAGLRAILIARALERIGDNAVDIGEQTAYLVTGQFREFTDASRPASV